MIANELLSTKILVSPLLALRQTASLINTPTGFPNSDVLSCFQFLKRCSAIITFAPIT